MISIVTDKNDTIFDRHVVECYTNGSDLSSYAIWSWCLLVDKQSPVLLIFIWICCCTVDRYGLWWSKTHPNSDTLRVVARAISNSVTVVRRKKKSVRYARSPQALWSTDQLNEKWIRMVCKHLFANLNLTVITSSSLETLSVEFPSKFYSSVTSRLSIKIRLTK